MKKLIILLFLSVSHLYGQEKVESSKRVTNSNKDSLKVIDNYNGVNKEDIMFKAKLLTLDGFGIESDSIQLLKNISKKNVEIFDSNFYNENFGGIIFLIVMQEKNNLSSVVKHEKNDEDFSSVFFINYPKKYLIAYDINLKIFYKLVGFPYSEIKDMVEISNKTKLEILTPSFELGELYPEFKCINEYIFSSKSKRKKLEKQNKDQCYQFNKYDKGSLSFDAY